MTIDRNKNITSILYNHLNLPTQVTVDGTEKGNIAYVYDATGAKLKKIAPSGSSFTTTEYAGNYVYENGNLEFFNHPEGIVEKEADGYKYVYQFKDHLDNVRLSYSDKNKDGSITQDEIIQEKNYYPFGLEHKGYNNTISGREHNYGFGGKEENSELGLEWMDFGARNYDASLGRWMNLDPLAEDMRRHSPYNYAFNSPISFIDPDGMKAFWINNGDGTYTAQAGDSAATLAKDAGISFERAKEIMANTPNESSSLGTMGTYEDPEDGVEKSAVDEGDVVAIPEQVAEIKAVQETEAKETENARLDGEISNIRQDMVSSTTAKEQLNNDLDSLKKEWIKIEKDPTLHKENYGGEPGGGLMFLRIIKQTKNHFKQKDKERKVDSIDKVIKKQTNKMDSVNKLKTN